MSNISEEATAPGAQVALVDGLSRIFVFTLARFLLRADRLRRASFGGDATRSAVFTAVAVAALERRLKDSAFRARFGSLATPLEDKAQRPVSFSTIEELTSIPHETVRRRVHELSRLGMLKRFNRSDHMAEIDFLNGPEQRRLLEALVDEAVTFINQCLERGVVMPVAPAPDGKSPVPAPCPKTEKPSRRRPR
jgi:hypothetical protein